MQLNELLNHLGSSTEGLTTGQLRERRNKFGPNIYKKQAGSSISTLIISQFRSPLTVILLIVVGVSFYTSEHVNAVVILVMLILNAVLGFVQEFKAKKSLERLQKLIKVFINVKRDGVVNDIDSRELVPGDIVYLNHGSVIPADIRLIQSNNLYMNESALTGESREVAKNAKDISQADIVALGSSNIEPQNFPNFVFQGTSVLEGSAIGVVVTTGSQTLLAQSVQLKKQEMMKSNYVRNINKFSRLLFYFVIVITNATVVINISLGRDLLASFVLGISLALGITPETMPVVISIALSTAAYKLSKKKVLIKRLSVFEDFGNVDVICTDKTGTITTGELQLVEYIDLDGKRNLDVLEYAGTCSSENSSTKHQIYANQIDKQIWQVVEKNRLSTKVVEKKISKVWDFNFNLRSMGVAVETGKGHKVIVKGAYESISKISKSIDKQKNFEALIQDYGIHGYKVIAVATKEFKNLPGKFKEISGLDLQGFLLFKDVPRENMKQEFNKLRDLNIELKILTGDSSEITKHICQEVGLEIKGGKIVTGSELDQALAENLSKFDSMVTDYNVFARVSPIQKLNIIESLKRNKHVVAYLGDGINDVGALESADVGIAVDTATDVAKDTADIIILDSKLTTVTNGILEGRKVFVNTMKFIFSTMSSSFGNVITITFASLFLPFIPLLPVQVILVDFLSDFQHLAISTDNVDKELTKKPKNWDFRAFYKFVVYWGVISTVFDFFHIVVIKYFAGSTDMFRTTWIIESITTEILATFSLRTSLPFFKSRPSNLLIIFSIVPIVVILGLSYIALGDKMFSMVSPGLFMVGVVLTIVLIYFVVLELVKKSYFRGFWKVKLK